MDIKERLAKNEQGMNMIKGKLQEMELDKQQLLQEMLRLDGEHRLLLELSKEEPPKKE